MAPKWRSIPATEGQDFATKELEIKEKLEEFGQNETISGQIADCIKFNKHALLTLRASFLKYTCNPPKHLFSQYSEYSEFKTFVM